MDKRLAKSRKVRFETPSDLVGAPPALDTYIIVTDRQTAERFVEKIFSENENFAPQRPSAN